MRVCVVKGGGSLIELSGIMSVTHNTCQRCVKAFLPQLSGCFHAGFTAVDNMAPSPIKLVSFKSDCGKKKNF